MTTDTDVDVLLALATDIAHEAGHLLRSYAGRADLDVSTKTSGTDPVSAADRASEQLISDRVRSARPDDGLLGEERSDDRGGSSGVRWVVDPLDGTVNYLYGIPQWCVSIGVEQADGPLVGVVYDPNRDETFAATRGGGATVNGSAVHMTAPAGVGDALIATGYSYEPAVRADQADMLTTLIPRVRDVRRFGSAALDLSWLAAGRWDGYAEFTMQRWDYAAGKLVVQEAGGTVTHWELALGGRPRHGLAAGTGGVHAHLAEWLSAHGAKSVDEPEHPNTE